MSIFHNFLNKDNYDYRQQFYMSEVNRAILGGTTPMQDDLVLIEAPSLKKFGVFINGELLEKTNSHKMAKAIVLQLKEYSPDFLQDKEVRIIRLDNKQNFQYNNNSQQ